MKLAFSTLGCPDWSVERVVSTASSLGYDGVEVRGFSGRVDIDQMPEFNEGLARTRALFHDAGLEICCISTSVSLSGRDRDARRAQVDQARRAIDVAAALGAPFVRVFGGRIPPDVSRPDAADDIAQVLTALGGTAASVGVTVVLETHDDFCRGKDAADIIDRVSGPGVGILWDILHPYRCGEALTDTLNYLGGHIRHVHVKDGLNLSPTGFKPVLLGEGEMPWQEAVRLLGQIGYTGYLSLEWEKRWHPEIPDPEIAFPQYMERMREFLHAS
ncbi:MAG TPA: sugar phosphate isomerase/epimerase family protein [Armatimonadota bacterium]|nr:sugar phosphate isomerase/epimerase family protein [Armatimonadota bacterium]